ncbi:hypothetical protein CANARDRAFT_28267 [[Candida] arabinofermentans NRRL YB-2248]|uniref:Meiotic nuclear division protein 1 n=1 Tax=[Candida] arabinofermentans NRRL YB-2248 TaxID=983967 RepID=A0A1E4T159_9ASCO|nr:hypothetical protein CANARDRAFT_28267 [[Candida] arabinofermentans NRRL YB-2248]
MPPKKGLSLDEKRQRLLDWFNAEHTMYNIKEIENVASKKTGISSMQIKDVLQTLLDDDLVNCEKCGVQNIYWVFKYDVQLKLNNKNEKLKKDIDALKAKNIELKEQIELEKSTRLEKGDDDIDRSKMMLELKHLKAKVAANKEELDKYRQYDPAFLKQAEQNLSELQEGCEVLADNIETIVSFFGADPLSGISSSDFRKEFGIPEEFIDL